MIITSASAQTTRSFSPMLREGRPVRVVLSVMCGAPPRSKAGRDGPTARLKGFSEITALRDICFTSQSTR